MSHKQYERLKCDHNIWQIMSIEYKVSEVIPSLIIPLATLPFTSNPLDGEHETYHTLIRSHNPFERMDQMCGHKPKLSHKISGISDRALVAMYERHGPFGARKLSQCNLEIHLISKFLKTMTVWHPFWRLLLGSAFWELMVTFGNSLKPFLLLLFNSCNIFSHLLTLAHAVTHSANCHMMASIHSSPPDAWVEHPSLS